MSLCRLAKLSISGRDKPSVSRLFRATTAELGQLLYVLISDFKKPALPVKAAFCQGDAVDLPRSWRVLWPTSSVLHVSGCAAMPGARRFSWRPLASAKTKQPRQRNQGQFLTRNLWFLHHRHAAVSTALTNRDFSCAWCWPWLMSYHPRQDGAKGVIEGRQRWRSYLVSSSLMQSLKIIPTTIDPYIHNIAC